MLKRDPAWDPLRQNPEFQKLLKDYNPEQPPNSVQRLHRQLSLHPVTDTLLVAGVAHSHEK